MKKKSVMSIIVIAMVSVLMIGATMSWFTNAVTVKNTFTAGTVKISVNGKKSEDEVKTEELACNHWNPGDKYPFTFDIKNTGSKSVYVRLKIENQWYNTKPDGSIDMTAPLKNLLTSNALYTIGNTNDWIIKPMDNNGVVYCYFKKPVVGTLESDPSYATTITDPGLSLEFGHDESSAPDNNDNNYQGKGLGVTITVEAIQSKNVVGTDNKFSTWDVSLDEFK